MSSVTVPSTLDHIGAPRNHLLGSPDPTAVSYTDQLGPVAAALDFLGDTWSILVLRDLLWHGPQTTAMLTARNGGVDEFVVSTRVDHLAASGLVEQIDDGARPVVRVTDLGRAAAPVVEALCDFGEPLVARQTLTTAMLHQLVAAAALDHHRELNRVDVSGVVELDVSGRTISVVLAPALLHAHPGSDGDAPDATARCTQDVFVDIVLGLVSCDEAVVRHELEVEGEPALIRRLFDLLRDSHARRRAVASRLR